ncbi:MAG: hypothetical protein M1284_01150 [Candidatus Parvarchaeota archaeon]|jgi:hypothetical protein|nr:hypothetical protein [Candidatus Parvarchaeota archaeon]MCL5420341.1 hypothetical protein [Candidatus Parvarchaeota archaeon]
MKVSINDYNFIKARILRKLIIQDIWGAKHTAYDNLPKGLPKDKRGFAKDVADDLIKERVLLEKPTNYGLHVSLNPEKALEIRDFLLTYDKDQI